MAKVTFEEVLDRLGHNYCEAPPVEDERSQVRHIAKVYVPTGEIRAICGATDHGYRFGCPALRRDSNCPECLEIEGIEGRSLTKRSIMLTAVENMINIEQIFIDAMYWNSGNPDEEPINPYPDGLLANQWQHMAEQLKIMTDRARPFMQRHGDRFSWPEELK